MCKKLALVALLVAAGVFVLQKFDIRCCRKEKSLEQQIQDARDSLTKLDKEKRKLINAVAVKEVEVQDLTKEVSAREANLEVRKKRVLALRTEVLASREQVKAADAETAATEARARLDREYNAFRSAKDVLLSKKQVLAAARESLDADHQRLSAFEQKRDEMVVELDKLEAKLKKLRATQTVATQPTDPSEFARIKGDIAKLRKRIDVEIKKDELSKQYPDRPAEEPAAKKEVDVLKLLDNDPDFQRK
jgi:chromosome segregation ATPase